MNKLCPLNLGIDTAAFRSLARHMFDDPEEISEEYVDRDECRMQYLTEIENLVDAGEILEGLGLGLDPEILVGCWMLEISRTDSCGIHWDECWEIVRVEQVTETKTVTYWKPIREQTATEAAPYGKPNRSKK